MSAVDFAEPVASLGDSVIRALGNAQARFNESDPLVDGVFRNRPVVSEVGTGGAYAREPEFSCRIGDLEGQNVADRISIRVDHQAATPAWYVIKQRLPDDLHAGLATFLLEPAP